MVSRDFPQQLSSMSQADTESSEFRLGDGAERLEIMEARVEAVGQVLLQAKICERPLKVLGSHGRSRSGSRRQGYDREGARLAWSRESPSYSRLARLFMLLSSTIHRDRGGGVLSNLLASEEETLRFYICQETG
jgi:hypothetical protein